MSINNEKVTDLRPEDIHTDLPEDTIPKLDEQTVKELQAEQDAHLGVKAVEAAEKVYGRYSKFFAAVPALGGLIWNPCTESSPRTTGVNMYNVEGCRVPVCLSQIELSPGLPRVFSTVSNAYVNTAQ